MPDGAFILEEKANPLNKHLFFIELDRNMALKKIKENKIEVLNLLFYSKLFTRVANVKTFTLLFLETNQEKLEKIIESKKMMKDPGAIYCLFTKYENIQKKSILFDNIWNNYKGKLESIIKRRKQNEQ